MAYISDNRGFKSGGYNGLDPTNPPYGPEQLDSYAAGLKSEFLGHRLRLNSEAFYYNYKNIQVSKYTDTAVIYNGGRAKLYGIDVDGQAKAGPFTFTAALEAMHSEFTDFQNAQFSEPLPTGGALLVTGNAKGNPLPFTPQFTSTMTVAYEIPLQKSFLDLSVTNYTNSGYAFEPDDRLKQKSYDYLNAAIIWRFMDQRASLRFWADNLLDRAVSSFEATQAVGYIADFSNPPRTVGIDFKYRFGNRLPAEGAGQVRETRTPSAIGDYL
jgi:outer membrane receptor protein involved in Fe transport